MKRKSDQEQLSADVSNPLDDSRKKQKQTEETDKREIDKKLEKFKILRSRYETEQFQLEKCGYDEDLSNSIILRRSSKRTVATLLRLHDDFIQLHFTHAELGRMANHNGGRNNLLALHKYWKSLSPEEQTSDLRKELVRVVACDGGAKNLEVFTAYWNTLTVGEQTAEFRRELVRVVAHAGGANTLTAFTAYWNTLTVGEQTAEFRRELVRVVACDGGAKNLEVFTAYWNTLTVEEQTAEFRRELVRVVAHNGGANNLETLIAYWNMLSPGERTPELRSELVRVVAHDGGANNLTAVTAYWNTLPAREQTAELIVELVRIVSHNNGSKNLEAFIVYAPKLMAHGYTRSAIIDMLCRRGGSKNIQLVNSVIEFGYLAQLKESQLTDKQSRDALKIKLKSLHDAQCLVDSVDANIEPFFDFDSEEWLLELDKLADFLFPSKPTIATGSVSLFFSPVASAPAFDDQNTQLEKLGRLEPTPAQDLINSMAL